LCNTPVTVDDAIIVAAAAATTSETTVIIITIVSFFFSIFAFLLTVTFLVHTATTAPITASITTSAASRTAATFGFYVRFRARWRPPKPAQGSPETLNKTLQ